MCNISLCVGYNSLNIYNTSIVLHCTIYFQLEDINWRMNLQIAQSTQTKMKMPNAMFELGVQDDSTDVRTDFHATMLIISTYALRMYNLDLALYFPCLYISHLMKRYSHIIHNLNMHNKKFSLQQIHVVCGVYNIYTFCITGMKNLLRYLSKNDNNIKNGTVYI